MIIYHFQIFLCHRPSIAGSSDSRRLVVALNSTLTPFCCFFLLPSLIFGAVVAVPPVLRIWESDCYPQAFFTLHSFSIFGACTTSPSFYQGSIMSMQFFPEMCRAPHDRPSNSVCLNHAVFRKHLINQGLYLNLSRYDYKWLVAKRSAKFF